MRLALAALLAIVGLGAAAPAAVAPPASRRPPVVVVVFDALPPLLLEDEHRHIDGTRFPNFAALAATATWYRNATTISESTRFSVPALLDGRQPRPGVPETLAGHPRNLFTLLDPYYRLNVWEEATLMCPCKPHSRASVLQRMHHGRAARFQHAVADVAAGPRPQLTFIHTLLPHEPRVYLPDGRTYVANGADGLGGPATYDNRVLTEQVEQRELLQLEFADHLLGKLIARLKRQHVWNRAIVAVMSDHGESFDVKRTPAPPFRVGQLSYRRAATKHNLEDIAGIAMFVKYPGQRTGRIDNRFVRHPDLLPTILHFARVPRPPGLVGHYLLDPRYRGHASVAVERQDGRIVSMPAARWRRRVAASKARELRMFGSGNASLYDFGPVPALLNTPVPQLDIAPAGRRAATLARASDLAHVEPDGSFIPAQVSGGLRGVAPGRALAFGLNGRIAATSTSFKRPRGTQVAWAVMLRPDAFRRGANKLEIFEVLDGRRVRRLYP